MGASWVMRVAANKAIDLVRRNVRERARDRTLACLTEPQWEEPDLKLLLEAWIAELPPRLRQFYHLRYEEGWSEREVAAQLGKCRATVRWLDHCLRQAVLGK